MFGSDAADIVYGDGTGGSGKGDTGMSIESLAFSSNQGSSKKKSKPDASVKRPEGMARELWGLLDKDRPIDTEFAPLVPGGSSSSARLGGYKTSKAKFGLKKTRNWVWTQFINEARLDDLRLGHWRPAEQGDEDGVYPFARFNRVLQLPSYTDAVYSTSLQTTDWSRQQTDHLWYLCNTFHLRWPVIHDRWDSEKYGKKSMEDLKERYYSICTKLAKGSGNADHLDVGSPAPTSAAYKFDADHERKRKEQLIKLWNRTSDQIKEEEQLKQQLKRIEARKRERDRKAMDLQKLITASDLVPASPASVSVNAAASLIKSANKKSSMTPTSSGAPGRPPGMTPVASQNSEAFVGIRFLEQRGSGPRLRSHEMKLPTIGQKKLRAIEQALEKLQLEQVQPATEGIARTFNELRSDIGLLFDLKTALVACEYELESLRHQYLTMNAPAFEIPSRIRVSNTGMGGGDGLMTSSRTVTDAMDLQQAQGSAIKKRKSTATEPPLMKRMTRRFN